MRQLPDLSGTDAAQLTAVLRGQPLNLVRGRSVELDGPADAEFLIEGYIDAKEIDAARGTVTSPSGLLVSRQRLAVIRVTAVTHRSQPVLPSVVHAASDSEETAWYPLLSELLTPVMQRMHPAVQTFRFSRDGQGRRIGFVGFGPGSQVMRGRCLQGLANWPTLADAVVLVAVDEDLDLSRSSNIWQQVAANADPGHDVGLCLWCATPVTGLPGFEQLGYLVDRRDPQARCSHGRLGANRRTARSGSRGGQAALAADISAVTRLARGSYVRTRCPASSLATVNCHSTAGLRPHRGRNLVVVQTTKLGRANAYRRLETHLEGGVRFRFIFDSTQPERAAH